MKNISDYLHRNLLKFGIYLDYGTNTCEGYPGSKGFLNTDAKTLASWNVDYVKMDGCYAPVEEMPDGFEQFSQELGNLTTPIVFSCAYPAYIDWPKNESLIDWARIQKNCNLWRLVFDVQDTWDSVLTILKTYEAHSELLASVAGPGHWNDPDMLVLGNFGLSRDQQRVQMGMWCMFAAPLLISADMTRIDPFTEELLKNRRLIEINQDVGGHQAKYLGEVAGAHVSL